MAVEGQHEHAEVVEPRSVSELTQDELPECTGTDAIVFLGGPDECSARCAWELWEGGAVNAEAAGAGQGSHLEEDADLVGPQRA